MAKHFILKIGVHSPELVRFYKPFGAGSAFITAENPYGKKLSAKENEVRSKQLMSEMKSKYMTVVEASGEDPLGEWEAEVSCLVYGITLEDAKAIGNKYEQNAIVYCGEDAIPQLILLR
jgi:hypothetical protein